MSWTLKVISESTHTITLSYFITVIIKVIKFLMYVKFDIITYASITRYSKWWHDGVFFKSWFFYEDNVYYSHG